LPQKIEIHNCSFKYNNASIGGAVSLQYVSIPKITNNEFIKNTAFKYGGSVNLLFSGYLEIE
jgi:hypothetical protein